MRKKYRAKTEISLNVMIEGKKRHVAFMPMHGSASIYITSEEAVQAAMEKHPWFGRYFVIEDEEKPVVGQPEVVVEEKTEEPSIKKVSVSCWDDAKEYLVDRFGISRTKVRFQSGIKKYAEANGIEFVVE